MIKAFKCLHLQENLWWGRNKR